MELLNELINTTNKSKIKLDSSILIWIEFLKNLSVCLFLPGFYVRQLYVRFEEIGLIYGNIRVIENVLGISDTRRIQGDGYVWICNYMN
jgi:hypothetical protein